MKNSNDQLRDKYEALLVEHEALQRALQQLQHTEQLRQDLVGMLVHDLKVPLAVIMASLDLLADELEEQLGIEVRDVLLAASQSGRRMLQLVTNLLEAQRLEAGQMPLHLQPLDVADVLRRSAAQVDYLARQKGVALLLHIPERLPWAWADLDLTERVVTNLLDNAVQYTPAGGEIVVTSQVQMGFLTISVADGGLGIAADQQARLFDRFSQVEHQDHQGHAGVGLGLAFCKLAVEAQRGRIRVDSSLGTGARFSFTLPLWERNEIGPELPDSLPDE
jgi:signal transduction histidine kinase